MDGGILKKVFMILQKKSHFGLSKFRGQAMARMLLAQPCSTAVVGPTGVWHHASQIDLHQRGFRYECAFLV